METTENQSSEQQSLSDYIIEGIKNGRIGKDVLQNNAEKYAGEGVRKSRETFKIFVKSPLFEVIVKQ